MYGIMNFINTQHFMEYANINEIAIYHIIKGRNLARLVSYCKVLVVSTVYVSFDFKESHFAHGIVHNRYSQVRLASPIIMVFLG